MKSVSRELVLWLLQQGHQPVHLRPGSADALTASLEEAIHLREQNQAELSLALLERLEAEGFSSPWITDNRARAEHVLGRTGQAASLWQGLLNHPDAAAAEAASQMLSHLQERLLEGLHHHCSFHSWPPRHLPPPNAAHSGDALHLTLEEALSAREGGRAGLSLALMEEALQQGWQSPWLHDNRARALVNLGRSEEAIQVWRELMAAEDATAAAMAREALAQQQAQQEREQQRHQAQQLIERGERAQAQALLLNTWLQHPEDTGLLELMEQVQPAPEGSAGDALLEQELAMVNRRLALQEHLLGKLEERSQPSAAVGGGSTKRLPMRSRA